MKIQSPPRGQPAQKANRATVQIRVRIPKDMDEQVTKLQAITGANRSAVIIYLLGLGLKSSCGVTNPQHEESKEASPDQVS